MGKASRNKWLRRVENLQDIVLRAGDVDDSKVSGVRNNVSQSMGVAVGLVAIVVPRIGAWIVGVVVLAFSLSLYSVWHCYGTRPTWWKRSGLAALHVLLLTGLAWSVWPEIKVFPRKVDFSDRTPERYDFSVENQSDENKSNVLIPFDVGEQALGNFEVSMWPISGRPSLETPDHGVQWLYCQKRGSNRSFVLAFLFSMAPHETAHFSLTHKAEPAFQAVLQRPLSRNDPVPYQKTLSGTGAVAYEDSWVYIEDPYVPCVISLGAIKH